MSCTHDDLAALGASDVRSGEWVNLFAHRSGHHSSVLEIEPGPRDQDGPVLRFLRIAHFCEVSGAKVLERKARAETDLSKSASLACHAQEEREHAEILEGLLTDREIWEPTGPIRWAKTILARDRPLADQLVSTLVVESLGVAVYTLVADFLDAGRAASALRYIADDERVHLYFAAELLASLTSDSSRGTLRRMRRLRNRLVGSVLFAHLLAHRRFLEPVSGTCSRIARQRILDEVERSFSRIPGIGIPPSQLVSEIT